MRHSLLVIPIRSEVKRRDLRFAAVVRQTPKNSVLKTRHIPSPKQTADPSAPDRDDKERVEARLMLLTRRAFIRCGRRLQAREAVSIDGVLLVRGGVDGGGELSEEPTRRHL
jgi:hypothetical protein